MIFIFIIIMILVLLFFIYQFAYLLVSDGNIFGNKFRIVEFKDRGADIKWKIEHKTWLGWFHIYDDGEWWDGTYDTKEKAEEDYNKLQTKYRKIIKQ